MYLFSFPYLDKVGFCRRHLRVPTMYSSLLSYRRTPYVSFMCPFDYYWLFGQSCSCGYPLVLLVARSCLLWEIQAADRWGWVTRQLALVPRMSQGNIAPLVGGVIFVVVVFWLWFLDVISTCLWVRQVLYMASCRVQGIPKVVLVLWWVDMDLRVASLWLQYASDLGCLQVGRNAALVGPRFAVDLLMAGLRPRVFWDSASSLESGPSPEISACWALEVLDLVFWPPGRWAGLRPNYHEGWCLPIVLRASDSLLRTSAVPLVSRAMYLWFYQQGPRCPRASDGALVYTAMPYAIWWTRPCCRVAGALCVLSTGRWGSIYTQLLSCNEGSQN